MTDQELKDLVASTAVEQKENANLIREIGKQQAKTDKKLVETDKQLVETDKKLAETAQLIREIGKQQVENAKQQAKTDKQLAETDKQLAKTDAKLDRLATMYGGMSNNQGDVAEEFYYNSLQANPTLNGIRFNAIERNRFRNQQGIAEEYDILLINGAEIFIIEVKYKAHENDIQRFLTRKRDNFKKLFPEYNAFKQHLGIATFHINDDLKEKVLDAGMTLLQRKGDLIETIKSPLAS